MQSWSKIRRLKKALARNAQNENSVETTESIDTEARVQKVNLQRTETLSAMAVGIQILNGLEEPGEKLELVNHERTRQAS